MMDGMIGVFAALGSVLMFGSYGIISCYTTLNMLQSVVKMTMVFIRGSPCAVLTNCVDRFWSTKLSQRDVPFRITLSHTLPIQKNRQAYKRFLFSSVGHHTCRLRWLTGSCHFHFNPLRRKLMGIW